jgi:hypothetical protein
MSADKGFIKHFERPRVKLITDRTLGQTTNRSYFSHANIKAAFNFLDASLKLEGYSHS